MKKRLVISILFASMLLNISACKKEASEYNDEYNTEVVVMTSTDNEELYIQNGNGKVKSGMLETETSKLEGFERLGEEGENLETELYSSVTYLTEKLNIEKTDVISEKFYQGFELRWELLHIDEASMKYEKDLLMAIVQDGGIIAEYEYDDGHRTSKHVKGTTTDITYKDGRIAIVDDGDNKLEYYYKTKTTTNETYKYLDGFICNGEKYFFLYNENMVITGIEMDGEPIARYLYEGQKFVGTCKINETGEWELCEDEDFIGNINKIRLNSGLFYDEETGWYNFGYTYFDPVKDRGVAGISYKKCQEIMSEHEAGRKVDEIYNKYNIDYLIASCYDLTGMSDIRDYTKLSEQFVGERYNSLEWNYLRGNKYIEEAYAKFTEENPDRRYLSPHVENANQNSELYVYTGMTEEGKQVTVSHKTEGKLMIDYNTKQEGFRVASFASEESGEIMPAEVYFYDMDKDNKEELVILWKTIFVYDLETMKEIKFFELEPDYHTYKMSDEEIKILDDMLAEDVAGYEYGKPAWSGRMYRFDVVGDKVVYYRQAIEFEDIRTFFAGVVLEHNGTEVVKSYEKFCEINPTDEKIFNARLSGMLDNAYSFVENNEEPGIYGEYFGKIAAYKVWSIKVFYDNADYDNYAVEIYESDELIGRVYMQDNREAENMLVDLGVDYETEYNAEEYTLLYEFDLML